LRQQGARENLMVWIVKGDILVMLRQDYYSDPLWVPSSRKADRRISNARVSEKRTTASNSSVDLIWFHARQTNMHDATCCRIERLSR